MVRQAVSQGIKKMLEKKQTKKVTPFAKVVQPSPMPPRKKQDRETGAAAGYRNMFGPRR